MSPTKWTQKDSWLRYVYSTIKQIHLTFRAVLVTALTVLLWRCVLWPNHIAVERDDSEHLILSSAVVLMLALIFVGGLIYTKIDERRGHMVRAILTKNQEEFLILRDERTPNFSLVFLGTLSTLLTAHALLLHWETVWGGMAAVGTITFVCAKFWVLITYFDDPVGSSKWMRERVPATWMNIKIDEHFACNGNAEPAADA